MENIAVDEKLIDALLFISVRQYRIALDDVVSPDKIGSSLNIADIVKLDALGIEEDRLEA